VTNSEDFEKILPDNPLTWAYLPLTHYSNEKRIEIKAKAINGIAKTAKNEKGKATLFSLVNHTVRLTKEEQYIYNQLLEKNITYEEGKMLETIKDVGIEEGIEIGREEGREEGREVITEMLLMNIRFRFGNISLDTEQKVKAMKDHERIRELFTQSFSCDNEEQFKTFLTAN